MGLTTLLGGIALRDYRNNDEQKEYPTRTHSEALKPDKARPMYRRHSGTTVDV
jgi:hypothetical protein